MLQTIHKDVDGIKLVINFDYPQSSEDYIHRIGRTGRSSSKGTSYAFFTRNNIKQLRPLLDVLREAKPIINPDLEDMPKSKAASYSDMGNRRYGGNNGQCSYNNATFKEGSMRYELKLW